MLRLGLLNVRVFKNKMCSWSCDSLESLHLGKTTHSTREYILHLWSCDSLESLLPTYTMTIVRARVCVCARACVLVRVCVWTCVIFFLPLSPSLPLSVSLSLSHARSHTHTHTHTHTHQVLHHHYIPFAWHREWQHPASPSPRGLYVYVCI